MKSYLKYIVLVIVTALLIIGLAFGDIRIVIEKAANVCLECIGIG